MARNKRKFYEPSADEQAHGIPCVNCGCRHSYVLKTERVGDLTRRLRRCRYCGRTFFTIETS